MVIMGIIQVPVFFQKSSYYPFYSDAQLSFMFISVFTVSAFFIIITIIYLRLITSLRDNIAYEYQKRKQELKFYYIALSMSTMTAQFLPSAINIYIEFDIKNKKGKIIGYLPNTVCLMGWLTIFSQFIHIISAYIVIFYKSTDDQI